MANKNNGSNLGFEQKMWQAADKLRGNMDAAEYKYVVLGTLSGVGQSPIKNRFINSIFLFVL